MDDYQFFLYIIAFIIYIVSRVMKKAPKKNFPPKVPRSNAPKKQPQKQISFEELLEQFTEEGKKKSKPKKVVQEASRPSPQRVRHPQKANRPARDDQRMDGRNLEPLKAAKLEYKPMVAKSLQPKSRPSTEPKDEIATFKMKNLEVEEAETTNEASFIHEALSNPSNARQAVILSEIFNRKY